jgi:AcrR family transcriptional regulator
VLAAISLLAERGYDPFTLADVGGAASGCSRGLTAHSFGRKEDLLAEVVRYMIEFYTQTIAKLFGDNPRFPRLCALIRE